MQLQCVAGCQKHFVCSFVFRGVFKEAVGNWNWCWYGVKCLMIVGSELDRTGL